MLEISHGKLSESSIDMRYWKRTEVLCERLDAIAADRGQASPPLERRERSRWTHTDIIAYPMVPHLQVSLSNDFHKRLDLE